MAAHEAADVLIDDVPMKASNSCPRCGYDGPYEDVKCTACGERVCVDDCATLRGDEWFCRWCDEDIAAAIEAQAAEHDGRHIDEAYALMQDRQMGVL